MKTGHNALDTLLQTDNFIKVAVWDLPEDKGIEVTTLCCLHGAAIDRVAILSNILQTLEIDSEELLLAYQMYKEREDESKNNEG